MNVNLNGVTLSYETVGSGPSILFIHDGADSKAIKAQHFTRLAQAGFRVVFTSLHGFAAAGETPLRELTRDAVALLNYLGIGRAVILGVGRGGYVLLDLLERYPGRVAAASLVVHEGTATEWRQLQERVSQGESLDAARAALLNDPAAADEGSLPLAEMPTLKAWAETAARSRRQTGCSGLALLRQLQLPPLLLETPQSQGEKWRLRLQRFNPFALTLQGVLDLLAPVGDESDEEVRSRSL